MHRGCFPIFPASVLFLFLFFFFWWNSFSFSSKGLPSERSERKCNLPPPSSKNGFGAPPAFMTSHNTAQQPKQAVCSSPFFRKGKRDAEMWSAPQQAPRKGHKSHRPHHSQGKDLWLQAGYFCQAARAGGATRGLLMLWCGGRNYERENSSNYGVVGVTTRKLSSVIGVTTRESSYGVMGVNYKRTLNYGVLFYFSQAHWGWRPQWLLRKKGA